MFFFALVYHDFKIISGVVEPMQKINPYAISKWSWWERQAVTTTVLTLGKMVGEVIYLAWNIEKLDVV